MELGKEVFKFNSEPEARRYLSENPPNSTVYYINLYVNGLNCVIQMINGKMHQFSYDDYNKAVREKRWREAYFERTGKKWESGEQSKTESTDPVTEINSDELYLNDDDCLKLLGLAPGFSVKELKKAYRETINKYHPDKVAALGDELKILAEKRAKQINQAYSRLLSKSKTSPH